MLSQVNWVLWLGFVSPESSANLPNEQHLWLILTHRQEKKISWPTVSLMAALEPRYRSSKGHPCSKHPDFSEDGSRHKPNLSQFSTQCKPQACSKDGFCACMETCHRGLSPCTAVLEQPCLTLCSSSRSCMLLLTACDPSLVLLPVTCLSRCSSSGTRASLAPHSIFLPRCDTILCCGQLMYQPAAAAHM